MSDKAQWKEKLTEEKEKLSKLSWPAKIEYLFNYYKVQAAIFISVIAIAVILITHFIEGQKEELISGIFVNTSVTDEGFTLLSDGFFEHMEGNPSAQTTNVLNPTHIDFSGTDNSEFNYAESAKIIAMVSTQTLDFMFVDETALEAYGSEDGFRDLSEFLPKDLYQELEDKIVTSTSSETGETYPSAIEVNDTSFGETYGFETTPTYLAFIDNSTRPENSLEFLRYFLSLE